MIRILDRYLGGEFLKLFCLALPVLVTVSVLVNLFEKLHVYAVWGASAFDIMSYYFYTLPRETLRHTLFRLLIASFFSVGKFNWNYDLLAIQRGGGAPPPAVSPLAP